MERLGSSQVFIGNIFERVSIKSWTNGLVANQLANVSSNSNEVLNQQILAGHFRSIQDLLPESQGLEVETDDRGCLKALTWYLKCE
jgi:hypothetical protein